MAIGMVFTNRVTKVLIFSCLSSTITLYTLLIFTHTAFAQSVDSMRTQLKSYATDGSPSADSASALLLHQISTHYRNSNIDSALYYGERALSKVEKYEWNKLEADIRYNMAAAYYVHGEYDQTLGFAREAYQLYKKTDSEIDVAKVLNIEGLVFAGFDDHDKALEMYREAEKILDNSQALSLENKIHYNIAISLQSSGESEKAFKKFQNSLDMSKELVDSLMIARNHTFMAEVLISKEEYTPAREHLDKARRYLNESDKWDLSFTYGTLAKLNLKTGNLQGGVNYGERSYKMAKMLDAKWELQRITKILADIYAALNNFEKAFKYQKEHTTWNKEVYNEKREQNLARLELAREEAVNAELKAKNEQQKKNIQQFRLINLSLGVTIFFIGVIAVIIYRSNRKQKALNEQLNENNVVIEKSRQKIEQKNEELEQLNKTKNKILSVISHDARGPMTSLHSLIEFVEQYDVSREDMESILDSISNNLQQTTQMLDNIMNWAQSQFDTHEPDIRQVDLNEVTSVLEEEFAWRYNTKGVALNFDIKDDAHAMADENMVVIVLRNLVSNALKFCSEGHRVTITAEKQRDSISISVKDTGIGMDEEVKKKIFSDTPYTKKGTDNESGSGFGLKICKEFVEMNKGTLTLDGQPGKGTTATVRLPVAKKTAPKSIKEEQGV